MTLAGCFARRMLFEAAVVRGMEWISPPSWCVTNLLSFTRDSSLPGGQHSCFLSSLCLFEKDSGAQRVLKPGTISDGPGRVSAFHHSLHETPKRSSELFDCVCLSDCSSLGVYLLGKNDNFQLNKSKSHLLLQESNRLL